MIYIFYDPSDSSYAVSIDGKYISMYSSVPLNSWGYSLPPREHEFTKDSENHHLGWTANGCLCTQYDYSSYEEFYDNHPELFI